MSKQNQILAARQGVQATANKALDAAYFLVQKADPFSGLARAYTPRDTENGDTLPSEKKIVQATVPQVINDMVGPVSRWWDLMATMDRTNQDARADVVLPDGTVLAQEVPVATLIFLQKRLTDFRTFISALPLLEPTEVWHYDAAQAVFATDPVQTVRTKKIMTPVVLYAATDKHPAQVKEGTEDVIVGTWSTVKYSGAVEKRTKDDLLGRLDMLITAVRQAREAANMIEAVDLKVSPVLTYLFE